MCSRHLKRVTGKVPSTGRSKLLAGEKLFLGLSTERASAVLVIKRSLSPGFAGIKNELFEYDNTMMLFADAKQALQDLVAEMKEISAAA